MPLSSNEKSARHRAKVNADPVARARYLARRRERCLIFIPKMNLNSNSKNSVIFKVILLLKTIVLLYKYYILVFAKTLSFCFKFLVISEEKERERLNILQ